MHFDEDDAYTNKWGMNLSVISNETSGVNQNDKSLDKCMKLSFKPLKQYVAH